MRGFGGINNNMKAFINLQRIDERINGKYNYYPDVRDLLNQIRTKVQFGDELSKYLKEKAIDFGIVQAIYKGEYHIVNGIFESEMENSFFDLKKKSRLFDLGNENYHTEYVHECDLDEPNKKYYKI